MGAVKVCRKFARHALGWMKNMHKKSAFRRIGQGIVVAMLMSSVACAYGEEAVLYSYMRTSSQMSSYCLLPQVVEMDEVSPRALFDALRRRKLPTYGATQYDASKNLVEIDHSKCAYGAVISSEIDETFFYHGFEKPEFHCDGKKIASGAGKLPRFSAVLPFWQAFDSKGEASPSLVQIGNSFVPFSTFQTLVKNRDASVMNAVESGLKDPEGYVRSGIMRGMIAHQFSGAEARLAKLLSSNDAVSSNAAFDALLACTDERVVEKMIAMVKTKSAAQIERAKRAVHAKSALLRDSAMGILMTSSDDAAFDAAMETLKKLSSTDRKSFLASRVGELLSGVSPEKSGVIANEILASGLEAELETWLESGTATQARLSVAAWGDKNTEGSLQVKAQAILTNDPDSVVAYRAMDRLESLGAANSARVLAWLYGMNSPHIWIRTSALFAFRRDASAQDCDVLWRFYSDMPDVSARLSAEYSPAMAEYLGAHCAAPSKGVSEHVPVTRMMAVSSGEVRNPQQDGAILAIAKASGDSAIDVLAANAFSPKVGMRRDIAWSLHWMGTRGDSLRATLLKDSDSSVVLNALWEVALLPSENVSPALVKEIASRVANDAELRMTALFVLSEVIDAKNGQAITTFASNEMFDASEEVRIAAIRALGKIALQTRDPISAENALSSLALMAQDKSAVIVYHTITVLKQAHAPDIERFIENAKRAHPELEF